MHRPQPTGMDFFLYARAECEWARTCSYTRERKGTGQGWNATGRGRNMIGREQNANGRGRVAMDED
jgi:hypothetical protein